MQIAIFSTKRSTHHAFIEGLLKGRGYIYKNNCTLREGGLVSPKKILSEGDKKILVASFEHGFSLADLNDGRIYRSLGMESEPQKIVYLRDPLNTAASTYSIYKKVEKYDIGFVERNIQHYCSIIEDLDKYQGFIFICANKFWSNFSYRNIVLKQLGLLDNFVSYDSKQSYFGGGGNSFFENKDEVNARDLCSRFLNFKTDKGFVDLVKKYRLKEKAVLFAERTNDRELFRDIENFFI